MKKSQMARIVEFDRLVRGRYFPSRAGFSADMEVCERTVARDIDYLRDTLRAPLAYDANRRGYYYTTSWQLPCVVQASAGVEDRVEVAVNALSSLTEEERERVLARFRGSDNGAGITQLAA